MCKTIVKQNYFTFHKKHYVQPEGIALGVPTSAILSQIYLQMTQKQITNLLTKPKIVGYFRGVDDITVVFDNTNKVTQLHVEFNRQEKN
jgi:hypothetical protein